MSGMSALWLGFGSSNSVAKTEKAQAQLKLDLKYLYSAFTKIPCLRLAPDRKARLIRGYEEFPFDTAVPLLAFKNLSALEVCDVDFRQFFGWDKLAEQLRSLTLKRACVDDPNDLFTSIVLDDMDKRRRRSSKAQSSPVLAWPLSPPVRFVEAAKASSTPSPPVAEDNTKQGTSLDNTGVSSTRNSSSSPKRPTSSRQNASFRHMRSSSTKIKRSGSGSSDSSVQSNSPTVGTYKNGSSSNLLLAGTVPSSKWRFLRHLSLADNALTSISANSLMPLANSLLSLDLSSNLFTEVPDGLAHLIVLRALNLSNCMIGSLQSLIRNPLPAITALNLRANRLSCIVGVERLLSLERLDLRENKIGDPTELARLTGLPDFREVWLTQNPFTKIYSNHRVTIFNLFRKQPGLINDISIDSSGPTYYERKQLVDRVVEGEPVSVVPNVQLGMQTRPPTSNDAQQDESMQQVTDLEIGKQDKPAIHSTPGYQYTGATVAHSTGGKASSRAATRFRRSRKGVRRQRLVDLAATEDVPLDLEPTFSQPTVKDKESRFSSTKFLTPDSLVSNESSMDQPRPLSQASATDQDGFAHVQALSSPPFDGGGASSSHISQHTKLQAQAYRQRIETFKQEVGSSWLNAFSEEGWVNHREADAGNARLSVTPGVRSEISLLPSS